ncbi:LOW QUALITY PROTEIN: sulfate transporter-like [Pomacea canaliculata]|uniref:LOW QUALITY PROTEIN: sulfate transporter-like n=1 Tax=Pomacea canaliculata TaxID=400727 RepID=UPI000D737FDD|nr:LOW QUALITY PROTEIN: sulfate transporter-like [Pomacea canaliculata]
MEDGSLHNEVKISETPSIQVNRPVYRMSALRDQFLKSYIYTACVMTCNIGIYSLMFPAPSATQAQAREPEREARASLLLRQRTRQTDVHECFSFLRMFRKYQWRSDLINDLISGLTVGIMQLPQGMAYAMLAELPPVVGLYMSFFPVIIYFLFGTSRRYTMCAGTVAVVSLMTGAIVAQETEAWKAGRSVIPAVEMNATTTTTAAPIMSTVFAALDGNATTTTKAATTTGYDAEEEVFRIKIATTVAFITGLAQIAMGLCRIGFLTTYMGDALVSGFTTGAAVHVFTSQVKYALGVKIPRFEGNFQVGETYIAVFKVIAKTNIAELVITLICIIFIYVVKEHVNSRIKAKCRIPIPVELIVVIAGTLASQYGNFRSMWGIRTVGYIPAGLPAPSVPSFTNVNNYGFQSVVVGIVAFAQSVSLAALMAKKHHYDIDANKELIGYGAGTFFGSFFSCYPIAASVSRSSVQDAAGGRTQLASLVSALLVLVVILFIGPLFKELPSCCLSAIIMVALRSMFLQVLELKKMYRVSPYDCVIWIVTFLSVVVLNVDLGLYIGIVFSFFTVVVRSQMTSVKTVENLVDTDIYKSSKLYDKTESRSDIRVVTYNTPLYYANGDLFMKNVYRTTGAHPEKLRKALKRIQRSTKVQNAQDVIVDPSMVVELEIVGPGAANHDSSNGVKTMNGSTPAQSLETPAPSTLIIDCSSIPFVDNVGAKVLKQMIDDYKGVGITVYLGGVRDEVWRALEGAEVTAKHAPSIYLTVYDAVQAAQEDQRKDKHLEEMNSKHTNSDPEATAHDQLLTRVESHQV